MTKFDYVIFDNKKDTDPKKQDGTFEELVQLFSSHDIRKAKDGPLFSPAKYSKGSKRANANVDSLSMLVLDYDNGDLPDNHIARWESEGWAFIVYSTFSHSPELAKWRAIFPLQDPVKGKDWPQMWRALAHHVGGIVDENCKDQARIYYLPCCPPNRSEIAFFHCSEGALLDASYVEPIEELNETKRPQSPKRLILSDNTDYNRRYVIGAVNGEVRKLQNASKGARHKQRLNSGIALGGYVWTGAITREEIVEALSINFGEDVDGAIKTIRDAIEMGNAPNKRRNIPEPKPYPAPAPAPQRTLKSGSTEEEGKTIPAPMIQTDGIVSFVSGAEEQIEKFLSEEFTEAPRALSANLLPVDPLTREELPEPFQDWIADIADLMSVPLEYPAIASIIALSTVAGRKIGIRPKQKDDGWTVVPNLWGLVVGEPGAQKTPSTDEAFRPLKRLASEAVEQHKNNMEEFEALKLLREAKAKRAKSELDRAVKGRQHEGYLEELAKDARDLGEQQNEPPSCRRYIVNDATVEALGIVLRENPNGVLVMRDELQGLLKSFEKQGHETDRAFYLEAWNGSGDFVFDRVIRGVGQHLKAVCLSLFGTIQPSILARYLRSAAKDDADGLVQRFQLAVYPEPVPFKLNDRYRDTNAKNRAFDIYRFLNDLDPATIGATLDDYSPIPYLRFSEEAQQLFYDWWLDLENNKLRSGEMPVIEAHLAKYRSLMPSLALLFHLVDVASGKCEDPTEVSLSATGMAAGWCDFLEAHARRIYQMAFNGDTEPAMRLAEKISQALPNPFTVRQVVKKGWMGLDSPDEVDRAIGMLEDANWVRVVEVRNPAGGRSSHQIYVNPNIHT